jgi:Ca-activated chloride channel family protein
LERLNVQVAVDSKIEIKNVYSPTHAIEVRRDAHTASVSFKAENYVPTADFRLFYDVEAGQLGASVLSFRPRTDEEGYFLLLASPQIQAGGMQPLAKTVLFVLDRSGSMSGEKIEQAKEALKFVLNNLREGDLFNIVVYDTAVESFRPELQRFSEETRTAALGYVEGIYAGGSTNIDGALTTAMAQLKDSSRPNYLLFLTDGLPTAGETNEMKIVANTKTSNQVRSRMIIFGVGYDLNSRLLDRLARANYGQSEYVRPDENIEAHVSRLYGRINSPVMSNLQIAFALDELRTEDGGAVNRVYPKESFDLFEGEQLVVVGRYKRPGTAKVTVTGDVGGQKMTFDFPAELTAQSADDSYGFVEKLWAMRRIGEIIDEIDLQGANDELMKELVALSTRHGILTPYTSFLADETSAITDLAANYDRAAMAGLALRESEGQFGVVQRRFKGDLQTSGGGGFGGGRGGASGPAQDGVIVAGDVGGFEAGEALPGGAVAGAPGANGFAYYIDAESDEYKAAVNCQVWNNKTFYCRDQQWIDSTVTDEMIANAKKVEAFSDEYFELADRYGKSMCKYLVFDEPVLLNLDGQAYLFELPAEKE